MSLKFIFIRTYLVLILAIFVYIGSYHRVFQVSLGPIMILSIFLLLLVN